MLYVIDVENIYLRMLTENMHHLCFTYQKK